MSLSVIILTFRRPRHLRTCLESISRSDLSGVKEVLVAVNGEDEEGCRIAESFGGRIAGLRVLRLPRRSRGEARNLALAQAAGNFLYFLDDDVTVPAHLFKEAQAILKENTQAWGIGGPNKTPPQSGLFEQSIGQVLESWLGAGPMRRRYKALGPKGASGEKSFALCNLCLRRAVFLELGLRFDPKLASAEENLLIARLQGAKRPVLYAPELWVYHYRRNHWKGIIDQVFKSGWGRRQVMIRLPMTASIVFFFPVVLCAYAVFLVCARPVWPYYLALGVYLAALLVETARWAMGSGGLRGAAQFFLLVPVCHMAYAAGFLFGGWF